MEDRSPDEARTSHDMTISSRTPEGTPNHCPVCNSDIRIEPSLPFGDAPCPKCGTLLWFMNGQSGMRLYRSETVAPIQQSLREFINETFQLNQEQTGGSGSFLADISMDSLGAVELAMGLEERFDLSVSEQDLRQMKTVGDVVDYIIRNSA